MRYRHTAQLAAALGEMLDVAQRSELPKGTCRDQDGAKGRRQTRTGRPMGVQDLSIRNEGTVSVRKWGGGGRAPEKKKGMAADHGSSKTWWARPPWRERGVG